MNKKTIILIIAAIILVLAIAAYFILKARNTENLDIGEDFVEVLDPVSEMQKNPVEPVAQGPVAVSGEIISDQKLNGYIYFEDNKIEVKDSKFSTSSMPRGTYEAEFVDLENNYYKIEPAIVQIFTSTTIELQLVK